MWPIEPDREPPESTCSSATTVSGSVRQLPLMSGKHSVLPTALEASAQGWSDLWASSSSTASLGGPGDGWIDDHIHDSRTRGMPQLMQWLPEMTLNDSLPTLARSQPLLQHLASDCSALSSNSVSSSPHNVESESSNEVLISIAKNLALKEFSQEKSQDRGSPTAAACHVPSSCDNSAVRKSASSARRQSSTDAVQRFPSEKDDKRRDDLSQMSEAEFWGEATPKGSGSYQTNSPWRAVSSRSWGRPRTMSMTADVSRSGASSAKICRKISLPEKILRGSPPRNENMHSYRDAFSDHDLMARTNFDKEDWVESKWRPSPVLEEDKLEVLAEKILRCSPQNEKTIVHRGGSSDREFVKRANGLKEERVESERIREYEQGASHHMHAKTHDRREPERTHISPRTPETPKTAHDEHLEISLTPNPGWCSPTWEEVWTRELRYREAARESIQDVSVHGSIDAWVSASLETPRSRSVRGPKDPKFLDRAPQSAEHHRTMNGTSLHDSEVSNLVSQVIRLREEKVSLQELLEQERERAHLIRTVQCNQQHAQFLRLSLRSVRRFCLHAFWAWQEYVQDVLGAKSKVALQRRVLNLELQVDELTSTFKEPPLTCSSVCAPLVNMPSADENSTPSPDAKSLQTSSQGEGKNANAVVTCEQRNASAASLKIGKPALGQVYEPDVYTGRINKKLRACAKVLQEQNLLLREENLRLRCMNNGISAGGDLFTPLASAPFAPVLGPVFNSSPETDNPFYKTVVMDSPRLGRGDVQPHQILGGTYVNQRSLDTSAQITTMGTANVVASPNAFLGLDESRAVLKSRLAPPLLSTREGPSETVMMTSQMPMSFPHPGNGAAGSSDKLMGPQAAMSVWDYVTPILSSTPAAAFHEEPYPSTKTKIGNPSDDSSQTLAGFKSEENDEDGLRISCSTTKSTGSSQPPVGHSKSCGAEIAQEGEVDAERNEKTMAILDEAAPKDKTKQGQDLSFEDVKRNCEDMIGSVLSLKGEPIRFVYLGQG